MFMYSVGMCFVVVVRCVGVVVLVRLQSSLALSHHFVSVCRLFICVRVVALCYCALALVCARAPLSLKQSSAFANVCCVPLLCRCVLFWCDLCVCVRLCVVFVFPRFKAALVCAFFALLGLLVCALFM